MNGMKRTKEQNKEMCERFPFLIPWNRFSGKLITQAAEGGYYPGNPSEIPEYDYEYTELDELPDGWAMSFGEQMCEELKDALEEDGDLDRWRIVQLKEKYGEMRLYDNGTKIGSRVPDIIDKYTDVSRHTCIVCGKPATRVTTGWISPFCDECCINCEGDRSISIEEWLGEGKTNGGNDHTGE